MPPRDVRLMTFAHLGADWAPCGQLTLTEEGSELRASSFAYGLNYLRRGDALEVDPVSLGLADREAVRGKRLLPAHRLTFFGGIRDAAPDAWGRRVIEAKLKVPANSLPESQYLLHAGGERVGALDVRAGIQDAPTAGVSGWHSLGHLMEAAERIEEGEPIPAHLDAIFHDGSSLGGRVPRPPCATSPACCGSPSSPAATTASTCRVSNARCLNWRAGQGCVCPPYAR